MGQDWRTCLTGMLYNFCDWINNVRKSGLTLPPTSSSSEDFRQHADNIFSEYNVLSEDMRMLVENAGNSVREMNEEIARVTAVRDELLNIANIGHDLGQRLPAMQHAVKVTIPEG